MLIKRIPAGVYAANCYIVIDEITKDCFVIDPGGDAVELVRYIKELCVTPKFILLTHGHFDHTGAVGEICSEYNISAHIHEADAVLMKNNTSMFGTLKHSNGDIKLENDVYEGKIFKIGILEVRSIETPGHTPGGVCYLIEDKLFTGDTLFLRSIGRTDFTGGSFETLISSINNKLMVLEENITVYPGHGPSSVIGYEKRNNSFL